MTLFIFLGFCAQLIDGCLGMAYGVFLTTFLIAHGVPLVTASAGIHFAEVFTTFASGVSHWKFKNIDGHMFQKLVIPGIFGGVVGAVVLSVVDGETIKPFVSVYLLMLGIRILLKIKKNPHFKNTIEHLIPLGAAGGFFDAVGGGGWGPIVASTLIAKGNTPSKVIGTVNAAEFFVVLAQSAAFIMLIGLGNWQIVAGLVIGGVLAAPLAAYLCTRINQKGLMFLVGILIVLTNAYALWHCFII